MLMLSFHHASRLRKGMKRSEILAAALYTFGAGYGKYGQVQSKHSFLTAWDDYAE